MNTLLNKSLEIAVKSLEKQNDKDLQFTRSLELANFIMDIQAKQGGAQIIEKEVEVIKEVIKEVPVEVVKEVQVEIIKEVPVETIKEVQVEVVKEVDSKATLDELKAAKQRIIALEADLAKARISKNNDSDLIAKIEQLEKALVEVEADADFYKAEYTALKASVEAKAVTAPTQQEIAAAEVNALKDSYVPMPKIVRPTEQPIKVEEPVKVEQPVAAEEPKKESPRPVVRLGAYLMPEANLYGYVYEAFIGDKKVFEKSLVKPVPPTSDKSDAEYAHYSAAAMAVSHARHLGFDKVKLVSTVNLRPDQMVTVTGKKYANIASEKQVEVFSKVNADQAYNEKAGRLVMNQILNETSKSEEAPF